MHLYSSLAFLSVFFFILLGKRTKVEYKKDEAYLHKKLFAKLPHKPGGSDRYFVSCMWNHDRLGFPFVEYFLKKWQARDRLQHFPTGFRALSGAQILLW